VAADAVVVAIREHAQQPRLQLGGHVADFVEKEGAALGLLETTLSLRRRAGEGAALVAEEFGFEQVAGNRRGVDGDEGLVGARTVSVHGARHQLLAGARFAGDQHGGARLTQATDRTKDFLHRGRLAEDFRHQSDLVRRTTLVQTFADRSPNQFQCLIDIEGLRQILEGAALKRRYGALEVGIGGHDDDRYCREAFLEELQQFQPRLTRHPDVRNQYLRRIPAGIEPRQRLCCRSKTLKRDFFTGQGLLEDPTD